MVFLVLSLMVVTLSLLGWVVARALRDGASPQKQSLDFHRIFFQSTLDLCCVVDPNGNFLEVNPAWQTALGWDSSEVVGKHFSAFVHPEDIDASVEEEQATRGGHTDIKFKNRFRTKSGQYRTLRWLCTIDPETGLMISAGRDVTDEVIQEERLARCLDVLTIGVWEVDLVTQIHTWDHNTLRLYGIEAEEFVPSEEEWRKRTDPGDYERVQRAVADALANDTELQGTYRILLPKGEVRHIGFKGSFTKDADGTPIKMIGINWDVTDVARITESLNLVIEGGNLGAWDWSLIDNTVRFNERWCTMIGLELAKVEQNYDLWRSRVHPEDLPRLEASIQDAVAGKIENYEALHRLRHADGSWVWILARGRVTERDHHGNALRFSGTHLDMTKQKEIEGKLEAEKKRFEMLVYGLNQSAMVSVLNEEFQFVSVNDRFCELTGYERDDLIGKHVSLLSSNYHPPEFYMNIVTTIRGGRVWHQETCGHKKDGSVYWSDSTIMPVTNELGERQYLGIRFDITARKSAEQQLLQSSKMASLGEMAGGVAHEINNPLAIIKGKAEKLRRLTRDPGAKVELFSQEIDKIIATSDRIAKIIKGLRTFSRNAESDPFEKIKVDALISETLELCQERFKNHNVEIILSDLPDLEIECRSTQISQVLLNLLNNAHDAIEHSSQKWISISVDVFQKSGIKISITDCGLGIPQPVVDRLMQPFFTTKEVGKGTGLGLSISRGIAQDHGGVLYLDRDCANTRFVLELPFTQSVGLKKKEAA